MVGKKWLLSACVCEHAVAENKSLCRVTDLESSNWIQFFYSSTFKHLHFLLYLSYKPITDMNMVYEN